ncbi:MAG: glycosyltransferase [Planctomycetota bacterium]
MFLTVAIPTYNRAQMLSITLESLRTLRCPNGADYEILVVNNNSRDNTDEMIRKYTELLFPRLRSASESRQGLSNARNRALHDAKGEIVCFLDDDVKVDASWLEVVANAFREYSAAVVGGRSYLIYPTSRPGWLAPERQILLSRLDHGAQTLVNTNKILFGLNFSVRRQIALEVGGFNANLGRCGKSLISGEERDFCERIRKAGGIIVYEPKAVVGHIIPAERLSKRWFLKRCYAGGVSSKRIMVLKGKPPKLSSVLIHNARCWGSLLRTMCGGYTTSSDLFERQMCAVANLGGLVEMLRYLLSKTLKRLAQVRKKYAPGTPGD